MVIESQPREVAGIPRIIQLFVSMTWAPLGNRTPSDEFASPFPTTWKKPEWSDSLGLYLKPAPR